MAPVDAASIARGSGGGRKLATPRDVLGGWHPAVAQGARPGRLPRAAPAVYVLVTNLADDADFADRPAHASHAHRTKLAGHNLDDASTCCTIRAVAQSRGV
jgi:hypothetical protein